MLEQPTTWTAWEDLARAARDDLLDESSTEPFATIAKAFLNR